MFIWAQTDQEFFELMLASAENVLESTEVLAEGLKRGKNPQQLAELLKDKENRGDQLTRDLVELLNRYFVTPFDREDILDLAVNVDNMVDMVEATACRMSIYKHTEYDEIVRRFANALVGQGEALKKAMDKLCARRLQEVHAELEPLYKLEKEADEILREGLRQIFSDPSDPILIIQKKEIYETLEQATDYAKEVADILKALVISHA